MAESKTTDKQRIERVRIVLAQALRERNVSEGSIISKEKLLEWMISLKDQLKQGQQATVYRRLCSSINKINSSGDVCVINVKPDIFLMLSDDKIKESGVCNG